MMEGVTTRAIYRGTIAETGLIDEAAGLRLGDLGIFRPHDLLKR